MMARLPYVFSKKKVDGATQRKQSWVLLDPSKEFRDPQGHLDALRDPRDPGSSWGPLATPGGPSTP